jgi:hypothetical protein
MQVVSGDVIGISSQIRVLSSEAVGMPFDRRYGGSPPPTRVGRPTSTISSRDGDVPTALSGLDAAAENAASRCEQNESCVLTAVSASVLFLCQPGNQSAR